MNRKAIILGLLACSTASAALADHKGDHKILVLKNKAGAGDEAIGASGAKSAQEHEGGRGSRGGSVRSEDAAEDR
jgi:hypothetical protein